MVPSDSQVVTSLLADFGQARALGGGDAVLLGRERILDVGAALGSCRWPGWSGPRRRRPLRRRSGRWKWWGSRRTGGKLTPSVQVVGSKVSGSKLSPLTRPCSTMARTSSRAEVEPGGDAYRPAEQIGQAGDAAGVLHQHGDGVGVVRRGEVPGLFPLVGDGKGGQDAVNVARVSSSPRVAAVTVVTPRPAQMLRDQVARSISMRLYSLVSGSW